MTATATTRESHFLSLWLLLGQLGGGGGPPPPPPPPGIRLFSIHRAHYDGVNKHTVPFPLYCLTETEEGMLRNSTVVVAIGLR